MGEMRLYTVLYTAVRVIHGDGVRVKAEVHPLIAANGDQAINSLMPQFEEKFPANEGWHVEAEAYSVNNRVIGLLVEIWGWTPPVGTDL